MQQNIKIILTKKLAWIQRSSYPSKFLFIQFLLYCYKNNSGSRLTLKLLNNIAV